MSAFRSRTRSGTLGDEMLLRCPRFPEDGPVAAERLDHLVTERGKTVAWHTLEPLAGLVRRHRADDTVAKAIAKLIRCDLVILDDVGMLPVSPEAAEALFRVVDGANERRSLALTSNVHPSGSTS
jgi:DNA replication protein DnaC